MIPEPTAARAQASQVVWQDVAERVISGEEDIEIHRHGKPIAVIVGLDRYNEMKRLVYGWGD